MEEISQNLFVGAEQGCRAADRSDEYAVVHACKDPCHRRALGYRGNLPQGHPNYLVHRDGGDLYLNMVDMQRKQSHEFMQPMISVSLDFVDEYINSTPVLIHCNQGQSRSPSLAMLYLAKRTDTVSDESYSTATSEFRELYTRFNPGQGIHLYLQDYWHQLE